MTPSRRTVSVLVGCGVFLSFSVFLSSISAQDAELRARRMEAMQKAAPPGAQPQAPPQGEQPKEGEKPGGAPGAAAKPGEKAAEKAEPARARRKPAGPANPDELKARLGEDGRTSFSFKGQDWEDVLEWLGDISNMSLQMEEVPPGFLNLTSRGRYTVDQIHDLVNSALINKGFTLLRNGEVLIVTKLEKLDKSLVPRVNPDELESRGTYEYVKCFFDLNSLLAEPTAEELKAMMSTYGKVTALKTTNRLDIVETAGNLRRIRDFLAEEQGERGKENVLREFKLKNVRAAEVYETLHTVLGLKKPGPSVALTAEQIQQMQQQFMQAAQQAAQQAAKGPGGKDNKEVFLAINKAENSILANAPPDKMAIIEQAVKAMDIPRNRSESLLSNLPRLRSYKLTAVDPLTLVKVLEDLGNLDPQSRLEVDARSRSILAFATPIDHVTIQAMVDKIDGTGRKFEVVQLYVLEAEMVAGSIEFLMRGGEDKNKSRSYNPFFYDFGYGPMRGQQQNDPNDQLQVEADTERNRLLIRATDAEMKEIRQLLTKLGEIPEEERGRQNMRVVPMSPGDMQKLLERIQNAWPSVAPNPLRVAPVETPATDADEDATEPTPRRRTDSKTDPRSERTDTTRDAVPAGRAGAGPIDATEWRAALANRMRLASVDDPPARELGATAAQQEGEQDPPPPARGQREPLDSNDPRLGRRPTRPAPQPPPISITPGPHGLVITSDDTEALDQMERMITELAPQQRISSKVFYLKNSFCKDVADVLKDIFRDGESSSRQPNPFTDDMYYYYRYGAGSRDQTKERGRLSKRKQLKFVPEPSTNTLLVLGADPTQLAEVERLIRIYDEGVRPDSNSVRVTKQLSFRYTTAKEVAEVIKDVFRDLLSPIDKAVAKPGQQQQQEQARSMYSTTYIFGSEGDKENARKFKGLLSMGVDDRSNTLIVSAPKDLMSIINQIADELDKAAGESRGVVQVLNLGTASGAVQQILHGVAKPPVSTNVQPTPEPVEKPQQGQRNPPNGRETTFVVPN
jgi:type II secretory pathway component GspD/PulD (secretin)